MQTYTHRKFYFKACEEEMIEQIDWRDIANAAANICRFNGHCEFYSVAEHCVRVSWLLPPTYRLIGLLHDGGEGYTGDQIYPIKAYVKDTPLELLANAIQHCVYRKADIGHELLAASKAAVKHADLTMLACEARDVLPRGAIEEWDRRELPPPPAMRIKKPWKPKVARARFLDHLIAYAKLPYDIRYFDGREL